MDPVTRPIPLWRRTLLKLDRWMNGIRADGLRRQFGACGAEVSIQWPVVVNGADKLRVGDKVSINAFVHIWAQGGVSIGDSTLIASHVAITSLTHDKDSAVYAESLVAKPVAIGRNVWIGTHAVVLPGVTIGDGAVVAAGAVVTRDVSPGDVVAGVPAASVRAARA